MQNTEGGPAVTVVAAGVDTLYHNFRVDREILEAWADQLAAWKVEAQESPERVCRLPAGVGDGLFLAASGRGHWQYILTLPGVGELMVNYHKLFAGARVRLFSEFLAGCASWQEQARAARELGERLFGEGALVGEQVSELHVAVDFFGWVPTVADMQALRFRCRADSSVERLDWVSGVIGSLRWGGHGSPVAAVLYDKGREIEDQSPHKRGQLDRWRAAGWSEQCGPVYRLEFRFGREALREMGVNLAGDVDLAGLLAYGLGWLSLRDVGADSNRSRWAVSAVWQAIGEQGAAQLGEAWAQYKREYRPNVSVAQLAAQVAGCAACIGALDGLASIDSVLRRVEALVRAQVAQGAAFGEMVRARRDRYMLTPLAG